MGILLYPIAVVLFWYKDAFVSILLYFQSLNGYTIRLFSLPGLFHTYFKPLKNEYRKNLVLFSILFGMAMKTILIIGSLSVVIVVFLVELLFILGFLLFPFLPIIVFYL